MEFQYIGTLSRLMASIQKIHDKIYDFLEAERINNELSAPLFHTFRRENNKRRLEQGYWFHGNDYYLVLSFWSGMDWKNKTPNIFFRIKNDGETALHLTAKDSIKKYEIFSELFVDSLQLEKDGKERFIKNYKTRNYLESLKDFLRSDKVIIDNLIRENTDQILSEDVENSVGFISQTNFQKWLAKIEKYRTSEKTNPLPYSLESIRIKHFAIIKDLALEKLPRNSHFVFLTGENGSGKTTFLRALSFALGNRYHLDSYNPSNSPFIINFRINTPNEIKSFRINSFEPRLTDIENVPFCCYGASRLDILDRYHKTPIEDKGLGPRTHALRGLFYHDQILMDLNRWIINSLSSPNNEIAKSRYEGIKKMLINIIPNLYDIREQPWEGTQELLYLEYDLEGEKIEQGALFRDLSSGLKSLIAMIGDMILRLFEQQPFATEPSELNGIVLIDEIDIHLHPKWQKKLPELLDEYFPYIQFILTTHSPVPLLGAPKNNRIFVIKRKSGVGVFAERLDNKIDLKNLLPNTILTSPIFDLQEIIPTNNLNKNDLRTEKSFSQILKNKETELKLKAIANRLRDEKDI